MLALLTFPILALLAGLALIAVAPPPERHTYVRPAVRTIALITTAAAYVTALFKL